MKKNKGTKVEAVEVTEEEMIDTNVEAIDEMNNMGDGAEEIVAAATSNRYKFDVDGKEVSRSKYIKHLFASGLTRSQIEEGTYVNVDGVEAKFDYKVVYSALVNMDNGVEDVRVRGGGKATIKVWVNKETNLLVAEGTEDAVEKSRKEVAIALYDDGKGMTRGDIAKMFNVKSPTIYAYTKPADGSTGSRAATILNFDKEGNILIATDKTPVNEEDIATSVKRSDFIRSAYADGYKDIKANDRGAIATYLQVAYQTVFQVTKSPKKLVTLSASTLEEFDTKVVEARASLEVKLAEIEKAEIAAEETKETVTEDTINEVTESTEAVETVEIL